MSELNEKIYKLLEENDCYVKDSDCSIDFDDTHEVATEIEILILNEKIELLNDAWDNEAGVAIGNLSVADKIEELSIELNKLTNQR